jgi:hypothetical protein
VSICRYIPTGEDVTAVTLGFTTPGHPVAGLEHLVVEQRLSASDEAGAPSLLPPLGDEGAASIAVKLST